MSVEYRATAIFVVVRANGWFDLNLELNDQTYMHLQTYHMRQISDRSYCVAGRWQLWFHVLPVYLYRTKCHQEVAPNTGASNRLLSTDPASLCGP